MNGWQWVKPRSLEAIISTSIPDQQLEKSNHSVAIKQLYDTSLCGEVSVQGKGPVVIVFFFWYRLHT